MKQRSFACAAIILSLVALLSAGETPASSERAVDEAVQLYNTRHRDPANLDKSQALLRTVLSHDPDNLRANFEFARVCFIIGDTKRAKNSNEAMGYYRTGAEYAKKAADIDDTNPWAHIWYAANLGRIAQLKGVLNSLGSAPEIKREVARALQLDPANVVALDIEAVIYYELPAMFGGDTKRSAADLKKAIETDPHFSLAYLEMARLYARQKDYARAREYLNKVLALDDPTNKADYLLLDKPHAEELLRQLKDK